MSEEKKTDEVKGAINKAFDMLVAKGRMPKELRDMFQPIVDATYVTVTKHEDACDVGAMTLAKVGSCLFEIGGILDAFETHVEMEHGVAPTPCPAVEDTVVEKKDNVIHVDLTKGARKN